LIELLFIVGAMTISAGVTRYLCRPSSLFFVLDHPNERSLHSRPTPRTGGLAIVVAIAVTSVGWSFYSGIEWRNALWLVGSILLVTLTSFVDDRRSLSVGIRLISHIAAAVLVVFGSSAMISKGLWPASVLILPQTVAEVTSVLFVVWMVNLYNFMDGMDGFAGGMAVAGFGTLGLIALMSGAHVFAMYHFIIAAAALGFLIFNFPPAKIFMGDVGSSVLGLAAALSALIGAQADIFPVWVAILVFSPFIVDATVTLIRRGLRGEAVWRPHRSHYYQRMVRLGWGHRRTALLEYAVMAGCAITALMVYRLDHGAQWLAIAAWSAFYLIAALLIARLEEQVVSTNI
jgi:UDP-N-acetylmuramyl pentapeptide phosphotransferase/UDP-N-acetylglucosamine-1-phosphate transferase